ncbi:hypothetical protein AAC691_12530 [Nguyenibacter vanlangensis]|uniref:MFS transporter n=1 Tax=Nguyenibacter vanlangensis TaxID=1216886 RepID=A0ABZ3D0M7_9PROT
MSEVPSDLERPPLLGAPYIAHHPMARRVAYIGMGFLMPIIASTQNALLSGNLGSVAGEAGLTIAESEWLIVAFVAAAAYANLVVIKGRQQFGIMRILHWLLVANVASGLVMLLAHGFIGMVVNRVTNGLQVSTSVAAGVYYFIQALPKSRRVLAIALAIASLQLANPIAALFPVEMLTHSGNKGFACLSTTFASLQLLAVLLLPLPKTYTGPVIGAVDLLPATLLSIVSVTLVAVLTLGRTLWWTDTPWIGWLLVTMILFLAPAVAVELCRTRPLLEMGWLSTSTLVKFVVVAIMERLLLSEQDTGVIGLFTHAGLLNDQFHTLYLWVILGMVCGIATMALTLSPGTIPFQCIAALVVIAVAAALDTGSNAQSRPVDMYFSQALLGFGTTLFVGPALLYDIILVFRSDTSNFISAIYVFAISQSLGSVIGSAVLGSLQYHYQRYALTGLSNRLAGSASTSLDVLNRGASSLISNLSDQSAVLGYINVFGFVRDLAFGVAALLALSFLWMRVTSHAAGRPS